MARLLLLFLIAGAAGCVPAVPSDVIVVDHARRFLGAAPVPPPDGAPGWEPVTLPDYWGVAVRRQAVRGWYRLRVPLAGAPRELWAVFLPRVAQTASVWVNGVLVGDGGPFVAPLPRNWNRPQLHAIPETLLRAGENTIDVRLGTQPGSPGFLSQIELGPARALGPIHEARTWYQVGLVQIVAAACAASGLLLFGVALRWPEFAATRWLGAGLVAWSWGSADAFVHRVPIGSAHLWECSTGLAPLWAAACFAVGFRRMLGLERGWRDGAAIGTASVVSVAVLAGPRLWRFGGTVVAWTLALGLGIYVVALLLRVATPTAAGARRRFVIPAAIGLAFGVHDLGWIVLGRTAAGLLLTPYLPVAVLLTTGWVVLGSFVDTLRETAALNRELETRVAEKHRELERNYARLGELERERAVADERERIMRDVHDGVGGQLVSTLALVEQRAPPDDTVAESLRGALEDLRLVIDSLDPSDDDLLSVLATVRSRLEPRLARHGLRFVWRVQDLPPVRDFGSEMALQVMRIVQEAVTNVVKHAGARTIMVSTGEAPGPDDRAGIVVEVRDDGGGLAADAPRGRGLANMRRRADRLGGVVDVRSDGQGTVVWLWLPRERPAG